MSMSISEKAMVVRLQLSCWTGMKRDRQISDEVAKNKGAEGDAGIWATLMVPKSQLKGIKTAMNRARQVWLDMTLPWLDDGSRILPAASFIEFTEKMRKHQDSIREEIDKFMQNYPQLLERAKSRLGELFSPEHFPTEAQLRAKFGMKINFYPIGDPDDFRVKLSKKEVALIKNQIRDNIGAALNDAIKSLYGRLHEKVKRVAERLSKEEVIFRDSLINNIKEFCEMLPRLNIAEDRELEQLRRKVLKEVASESPEWLRNDSERRQEVAAVAAGIQAKIEEYLK